MSAQIEAVNDGNFEIAVLESKQPTGGDDRIASFQPDTLLSAQYFDNMRGRDSLGAGKKAHVGDLGGRG
jgi:hypothetical protein